MSREYEDELTIEVGDEDIPVTVVYSVHGNYVAETWESPAEYPEVEVVEIYHTENQLKKIDFKKVFNERPYPLDKEWEPTPGLVDYGSWQTGALESASQQEDEDHADYVMSIRDDDYCR
jgi:hypothetical protein